MKYRMLRKNEKPDKAKGDEFRTNGRVWITTSLRGNATMEECHRAGNPCVYRRPVVSAKIDQEQRYSAQWACDIRALLAAHKEANRGLSACKRYLRMGIHSPACLCGLCERFRRDVKL